MPITKSGYKRSKLLGISCDAIPISGLIVEFYKLAQILHHLDWEISLDLGYEIRVEKNNFGKPYPRKRYTPLWINLVRAPLLDIDGYTPQAIDKIREISSRRILKKADIQKLQTRIDKLSANISDHLTKWLFEESPDMIVVENGTLPENIAFTTVLKSSITNYGREKHLNRYVLWRDHDLPWSVDPFRYPPPPFNRFVSLPDSNKYIRYAAIQQSLAEKIHLYSPQAEVITLKNSFIDSHHTQPTVTSFNRGLLEKFGIPRNADLFVCDVRIIPQKRIDRCIHLLHHLKFLYKKSGIKNEPYLVIAGPADEDPKEFYKLTKLCSSLGVQKNVIFANGLVLEGYKKGKETYYSVKDAAAYAKMFWFFTGQLYDSFGEAVGEAASFKLPISVSGYDAFQQVYGENGFWATILNDKFGQDIPDLNFAEKVFDVIKNGYKYQALLENNFKLCQRYFSSSKLEKLLHNFNVDKSF